MPLDPTVRRLTGAIGANVEIEWSDWGTMVTRVLTNKKPVGQSGGWSIFATTGSWSTWHHPSTNVGAVLSADSRLYRHPQDESDRQP